MRYRYYTSHALLQRRKEQAGSVPRVAAPEVEGLVCGALRRDISSNNEELSDKELIAQHVSSVIVRRDRIEVESRSDQDQQESGIASKLVIPFSPAIIAPKGLTRVPTKYEKIDAAGRGKLLSAIRQASGWVEAVKSGEPESFKQIAAQQGLGERHVRRLAVLAFIAPKLLNEIENCTAPAELTVSVLTEALPHRWTQQEAIFAQ